MLATVSHFACTVLGLERKPKMDSRKGKPRQKHQQHRYAFIHQCSYLVICNMSLFIGYFSEPFLESIPQVFILVSIMVRSDWQREVLDTQDPLFWVTFVTSVITASFGIARFLKNGPCKLVPSDGPLGGFGQFSFLLLMLNIVLSLCAKGCLFALAVDKQKKFHLGVITWLCSAFIPQMLYVSAC